MMVLDLFGNGGFDAWRFQTDIDDITDENTDFRRVLYLRIETGKGLDIPPTNRVRWMR
jgi:hypothetical protein